MCFGNMLKQVRTDNDMTQKVLANIVGVDQSRISAYENGEDIPNDIAINIIKALNSPRLTMALSSTRRGEVINIPSLTNVNEDVVNVLDVILEEAEEVLVAGKSLKKLIRNKKSRLDFTDIEMEKVMELEEQIADLLPCIRLHFVKMAEQFGLDIERVEKRMIMKLKRKKLLN